MLALTAVTIQALLSCSDSSGSGSEGEGSKPAPSTPAAVVRSTFDDRSAFSQIDQAMSLAYIARRFGDVQDLDWAQQLVDQSVEDLDSSKGAAAMEPFLRLITPDAPPPEAIDGAVIGPDGAVDGNVLLTRALWCDVIALPPDYLTNLETTAAAGDYQLTHAFGATQLLVENGCGDLAQVSAVQDRLAPQVAELLNESAVSDLPLQACSLLFWAGHGDLAPSGYLDTVRDARLDDGGWPATSGANKSDPAASVWGLRCALELEFGADLPPTPWVVHTST